MTRDDTPPTCVYPECLNTRRTRGLCHQHYQTMRSYIRDGKADEFDLMRRGLLLPKGQGGSPVSDHSAFLKGSNIRGDENTDREREHSDPQTSLRRTL